MGENEHSLDHVGDELGSRDHGVSEELDDSRVELILECRVSLESLLFIEDQRDDGSVQVLPRSSEEEKRNRATDWQIAKRKKEGEAERDERSFAGSEKGFG